MLRKILLRAISYINDSEAQYWSEYEISYISYLRYEWKQQQMVTSCHYPHH